VRRRAKQIQDQVGQRDLLDKVVGVLLHLLQPVGRLASRGRATVDPPGHLDLNFVEECEQRLEL